MFWRELRLFVSCRGIGWLFRPLIRKTLAAFRDGPFAADASRCRVIARVKLQGWNRVAEMKGYALAMSRNGWS